MERFPEAIADRYNALSGQECCLSCGQALSFTEIAKGAICVDLGSGQGYDVLRMAILTGASGFAYGIDISDGMIQAAKDNLSKLMLDHVSFIKSPLEKIDLSDSIADVIISNCTINHSLEQHLVWKEIERILKPGGMFVVSDIYAIESVPRIYAEDPVAVSECWAGAVTRDNYLKHVVDAGLIDIEILEESLPYEKGEIRVASFTIRGRKAAGNN